MSDCRRSAVRETRVVQIAWLHDRCAVRMTGLNTYSYLASAAIPTVRRLVRMQSLAHWTMAKDLSVISSF